MSSKQIDPHRPACVCDTCMDLLKWSEEGEEREFLTIGGGGYCSICKEFTVNYVYQTVLLTKLYAALTAELKANAEKHPDGIRPRPQPGEPTDMPVFDRLTAARVGI